MKNPFAPSQKQLRLRAQFHSETATYKSINTHPITATVLIPNALLDETPLAGSTQNLPLGSRPIIISIHAGGFIAGSSTHLPLYQPYVLDLALDTGAILLLPNYRLLPEASSALAPLEDLRDFAAWVLSAADTGFAAFLASAVVESYARAATAAAATLVPDLTRVLLAGDSAGGHLALLSALHGHYPRGCVRGMVLTETPVDVDVDAVGMVNGGVPGGVRELPFGVPNVEVGGVREGFDVLLRGLKGDEVVSADEGVPGKRVRLLIAAVQTGVMGQLIGGEGAVSPGVVVGAKGAAGLPARVCIGVSEGQGREKVVRAAKEFADLVNGLGAESGIVEKVRVVVKKETGGFGGGLEGILGIPRVDETPECLAEGVEWVKDEWLG